MLCDNKGNIIDYYLYDNKNDILELTKNSIVFDIKYFNDLLEYDKNTKTLYPKLIKGEFQNEEKLENVEILCFSEIGNGNMIASFIINEKNYFLMKHFGKYELKNIKRSLLIDIMTK